MITRDERLALLEDKVRPARCVPGLPGSVTTRGALPQISSSVCHTHHCCECLQRLKIISPSLGNACYAARDSSCIIHGQNKLSGLCRTQCILYQGQRFAFYPSNYLLSPPPPPPPPPRRSPRASALTLSYF